jgi:Ca2+-transporting ATPase
MPNDLQFILGNVYSHADPLARYSVPLEAADRPSYVAFTKGAVDSLLEVSNWVWTGCRAESLCEGWRARITTANNELAEDGMRVLGIAFRLLDAAQQGSRS